MPVHSNHKIIGRQVHQTSFLPFHTVEFQYIRSDGEWSVSQTHELVVPPDAAAVLAYHRTQHKFVFVKQFRIASVREDLPGEGWLVEIPAGRRRTHELARETARRELAEETGYNLWAGDIGADLRQLDRFEHFATIYPTPGITTERIFLFYVELNDEDDRARRDPPPRTHEDTVPLLVDADEVLRGIDSGQYTDAKLIVAAQWFRSVAAKRKPKLERQLPPLKMYEVASDKNLVKDGRRRNVRKIGIVPGDIEDAWQHVAEPIDIWVNSENTDMLMDRFFGLSISATIRRLGAEKFRDGTIYRDTIAEALRARMGGNLFVAVTKVVPTEPGALAHPPHRVRKIFHAAAVQGILGKGFISDPSISAQCVKHALEQAVGFNTSPWVGLRWSAPYRSILFPILGSGQGGGSAEPIAAAMVGTAVEFMRRHPEDHLQKVYFLAYTVQQYAILQKALSKLVDDAVLAT